MNLTISKEDRNADGEVKISARAGIIRILDTTGIIEVQGGVKRRAGHTTRQVDHYIQELYKNGYIEPIDHYGSRQSSRLLRDRILDRLKREHPHDVDKLKIITERAIGFVGRKDPYEKEIIVQEH